jgi:predicted DNA-binding transcriptional regulator AlpA
MSNSETLTAAAASIGDSLIRKPIVKSLCALTDRGIAVALQNGEFPKPIWLDGRNPAWFASEIRGWLELKRLQRDTPDPTREALRAMLREKQREGGQKGQRARKANDLQAEQA